jgi:hypothetical protein
MNASAALSLPQRLLLAAVIGLMTWSTWTSMAFSNETAGERNFRAGVSAVDISPTKLPVITSGGFLARSGSVIHDRLFARGMALDDGETRLVFVVVDTLFVPRDLCDQVKQAAEESTGTPAEHIVISAIHTHSGGSLVGCLGTDTDMHYVDQVRPQLVECIEQAVADLQPAEIGWSSVADAQHTHCRVFIRRPDCIGVDPFGEKTVRIMMHPGYQNPQYIGPSGPVDDELSVLSVRTPAGKPIGVLANYSMHYFGAPPISADYFGDFVRILSAKVAPDDESFVAMMSNGTSADLQWMDYANPRPSIGRTEYAEAVATSACRAYEAIEYHDWVSLGVAQRSLRLDRRVPSEQRWAWAQEILKEMGDDAPRSRPQVYAREARLLKENPTCELQLQAFRVGELGIAAIPNETYAITGLKLKLQCPLTEMFNIELANGCAGYIPPPEALPLGGYNAWPARTAGLQVDAETVISETLLTMFEELTGRERRDLNLAAAPYARQVLAREPLAYWRFGEIEGDKIADLSGNGNQGLLEGGYALFLDGPDREDLRCDGRKTRAVQFVGGRMKTRIDDLGNDYTLEMFFWNGLPNDNRPVTGYLFSRGPNGDDGCPGDHLGISGTHLGPDKQGRLLFYNGDERAELLVGGPVIEPKSWNHVRLVRRNEEVQVYLNFGQSPIISGRVSVARPKGCRELFIGGRSDNFANLEGRVADVAIFRGPMRQ